MNKQEKLRLLKDSGVVAVVRRPPYEKAVRITDALVAGGVKALEITVDSDRAFELISLLNERYGEEVLVGAGTVLDAETAEKAIEAGAQFIFSPILDEETIKATIHHDVISIPGVMTPTEIVKGYRLGADLLKIFPGSSLGVNYIKELSAPLGHIPMMPTGGVTLDNVAQFIRAGAVAVGLGSSLLDKKAMEEERYDDITKRAEQFIQAIHQARE
ncbi:bifunctional 4-hydroxy-2-oxoglutarate aldolase/2-dehydro-3-deoxy-phosphogluconate aldolase [Paenibacillus sp. Marseille-P2973]|uniref:bifunctional 4-hydroxy-2-oxoglutarate aldolase/2-dehydro-3-deoxy-phosphogluconate aldolase n=1 Tax=Paenibacillus sp. Marseille-P2973 TaxID=1871032 RepID=UPI001B364BFC|nr:bifunctional 4-hydroxy-2-oxoglutarate aldolase/2-dehydro-3-deoxy-phosphogluconate aldolase [Paenibacillus sp. Marseille-P2973]MBQ4898316.1 bifunctional 4-hydroxy-2-oxoglutarate aldolase/2-dehydro-3-deoxy-phosphogluconate aldolase [Paenibacillus sp. Marseille-P2973]